MIRTVITRFAFNGLPKDLIFDYDTETDTHIGPLVMGGYLDDITEAEVPAGSAQSLSMPSIDSQEGFGDISGQGADQPSDGGGDGPEAVDAAGDQDVQGDEGDGAKVAKGRKRRSDLSTDG